MESWRRQHNPASPESARSTVTAGGKGGEGDRGRMKVEMRGGEGEGQDGG